MKGWICRKKGYWRADRILLPLIVLLLAWIKSKVFVSTKKKCTYGWYKQIMSILVPASKVQLWSGYNHTDLNISKSVCLHQQLILNHPWSRFCPLAARNWKSAFEDHKVKDPSMEEAVRKTPTQQMVQSIPTWPQQLQGEMFFDQTSLQNLFAKLFGLGGFAFLWKSYWVFVWGKQKL